MGKRMKPINGRRDLVLKRSIAIAPVLVLIKQLGKI